MCAGTVHYVEKIDKDFVFEKAQKIRKKCCLTVGTLSSTTRVRLQEESPSYV
jgi:hypothetical protein